MEIQDRLPSFELKGTDGKMHGIEEFADKAALVIIVTCNHCPYAQAYITRINKMVARWSKQVGFIAINGNDADRYPADSFERMPEMAAELGLPDHYLHDEDQSVLKTLAAEKTPEVFLFNKDRSLVYRGAFDDNWEDQNEVGSHYLRDAIEASLAGESPDIDETAAVGCSVKWRAEKAQ